MRGTTFTKGKMNYFGSFSQQRTWAPLAQGEVGPRQLLREPGEIGFQAPCSNFLQSQPGVKKEESCEQILYRGLGLREAEWFSAGNFSFIGWPQSPSLLADSTTMLHLSLGFRSFGGISNLYINDFSAVAASR